MHLLKSFLNHAHTLVIPKMMSSFGPSLLKLQVILYKYSSLLFLRKFLEILFTPSSPKSVACSQVTVPVMSSWTSSIHPLVPNMPSQQLRWRTWTWEVWKVWMMTYFSQCGLFVVIFCNLYPLSSIFNIFFFARGLILLMAQILQQLVGGLSSFIKCKTRFWLAQLVGKFRH